TPDDAQGLSWEDGPDVPADFFGCDLFVGLLWFVFEEFFSESPRPGDRTSVVSALFVFVPDRHDVEVSGFPKVGQKFERCERAESTLFEVTACHLVTEVAFSFLDFGDVFACLFSAFDVSPVGTVCLGGLESVLPP